MAITSAGYDGTVTEVQWASLIPSAGSSEYGVLGASDFNVTAHPTTAYAVNVSAGTAWGQGVLDVSDSVVTVQCDAPATGVVRWDLICARRDWRPLAGGPTTLTKVNGGTAADIPAGRNNTPGTLDDQPLFLVQWTGGQTQPTAFIDLRCWAGNGGLSARNDLVRKYLTRVGTRVEILGTHWQRRVDTNGAAEWINEDASGPWVNLQLNSGWVSNGIAQARTLHGGAFVQVAIDARFTGGPAIYEGWAIANLPGGLVPVEATFIPGTTNSYRSGTIYTVHPGGVSVGPFPVGTIVQLNGIAPLK